MYSTCYTIDVFLEAAEIFHISFYMPEGDFPKTTVLQLRLLCVKDVGIGISTY